MTIREHISKFEERHGRLPSRGELSKEHKLNLSPDKATQALIAYVNQRTKGPFTKADTVKKESTHSPGVPPNIEIIVLAVGLLIIAVLTFILSVNFTRLWFIRILSPFIATAISVSMVGYMVVAPQASKYVRGLAKLFLWISFFIAITFSMGSTVAGQYNKLTENVDIVSTNDRAYMESLEEEIEATLSSIEVDQRQKEIHLSTMEDLSKDRIANAVYIATERTRVDSLNVTIGTKEDRIIELRGLVRAELESGTTGATVEREDFYTWISELLDKDVKAVEFTVSVVPAVFIDIIAALSLYVALELLKKKKVGTKADHVSTFLHRVKKLLKFPRKAQGN